MTKKITFQEKQESLLQNECFWENLYKNLRKPVTSFVHRCKVSFWVGQEDDLINDIIQETVMRIYNRFLTSPDEVFSIQSMEAFAYTIAYRYCLDLLRKEKRLTRLPEDMYEFEMYVSILHEEDELTIILDTMALQSLLTEAVHIIATIPNKQRRALLVDLAHYNDFTEQPTSIELALAEVGIQLRDYDQLIPLTHLERTRHNALVSLGYRRLRSDFQATHNN